VKVVEGSEIYNFPIHHSVHFSCKNSSYGQSNSASPKFSGRPRRRARAVRRLGVWAARAFPRSCLPEAGGGGVGHFEALRAAPTPRRARSLAGRPHSAMPCGPSRCSPVRARRPMPLAVPRVKSGVLHPAGTSSPLLVKNRTTPLPLSRLRSCHATAESPAGAIEGSRGELRVRPAAHQTELSSSFPCTYSSSPTLPSRRRDTYLAGAAAPAVGTGWRRGTPPPGTPPPRPNPQTDAW
jgi:hypothetical protein